MGHAATLASRSLRDESHRTALAALAAAAACTVLFGALWDSLGEAEVRHADQRAAIVLGEHAATPITGLAHASSFAGSARTLAALALTAAAWLLVRRRAQDAALVALALVGAEAINAALKNAFERPRPSIPDPLETAGGFSFPSGHAMASMALFATLAFVLTRGRSARTRWAAFGMTAALVGAIGLSRVHLGVHFPTDVAAGWSAGLAWAALSVLLLSLSQVIHPRADAGPKAGLQRDPRPLLGDARARLPARGRLLRGRGRIAEPRPAWQPYWNGVRAVAGCLTSRPAADRRSK